MCVSVAAFRKHSLKVKGQVSRWGQGRKTAKKWQIWTLNCRGISEHGNLFAVRSPKCAPTCALSIETPFDPNWWCWVELPNRNQMSDCQKMKEKKSKSAKRAFLGGFLTFWVNLIRRIRILDYVYPRYGPSKLKNVQKCEKMDQKSKFDFFVFLGNFTMENTNLRFLTFWLFRLRRTRILTLKC